MLGGSQALSRSLFSQMIPQGQEAEYFSLYEVSERGTSWLGPLIFGLALQFTGSYRFALLSVAIFFVVGLLLLTRVDVRRAISESGNEQPEPRLGKRSKVEERGEVEAADVARLRSSTSPQLLYLCQRITCPLVVSMITLAPSTRLSKSSATPMIAGMPSSTAAMAAGLSRSPSRVMTPPAR